MDNTTVSTRVAVHTSGSPTVCVDWKYTHGTGLSVVFYTLPHPHFSIMRDGRQVFSACGQDALTETRSMMCALLGIH